jgi:hypothetical protein
MNKKIYIILFIFILLFFFLFFFINKEKELVEEIEEIKVEYDIEEFVSEERKREIEEEKKDPIYQEFPLFAIGWTREQIIEKFGEPEMIDEEYIEIGEHIYYDELIFELENPERICQVIIVHQGYGKDVLGISTGMSFADVEKILGDPDKESMSAIGTFSRSYFFDNEKIRVVFITYEENGPIMQIYVMGDFLSELD